MSDKDLGEKIHEALEGVLVSHFSIESGQNRDHVKIQRLEKFNRGILKRVIIKHYLAQGYSEEDIQEQEVSGNICFQRGSELMSVTYSYSPKSRELRVTGLPG